MIKWGCEKIHSPYFYTLTVISNRAFFLPRHFEPTEGRVRDLTFLSLVTHSGAD